MSLDVDRRYQEVSELSADIDAYLDDQPVSAWREPITLSMQRWVRKRLSFVLICMLLLTLAGTVLVWDAYRRERRNSELASRVSLLFSGIKLDGSPTGLLGTDHKSPDLSRFAEQVDQELRASPQVQKRLYDAIGDHFTVTGNLVEGDRYLSKAMELQSAPGTNLVDRARTLHRLAFLRLNQGRIIEAKDLCGQAIRIREEQFGPTDPLTLASKSLNLLAGVDSFECREQSIVIAATPRYIRAWQEILEAKKTTGGDGLKDPDIGSIQLFQAALYANWGVYDETANYLTRVARVGNAVTLYQQAIASVNEGSNHPLPLLATVVESAIAKPLGIDQATVLSNAETRSERAFYGNRAHPGALVVKWRIVNQPQFDDAQWEETVKAIYEDAQHVFEGQPRAGEFSREYSQLLDEYGRKLAASPGIESAQVEIWFDKAGLYARMAIEQLMERPSESYNPKEKAWQVGEAYKTLARISQRRGQLEDSVRFYQQALRQYDLAGVRGYTWFDRQARSELATLLESMGSNQEADALRRENDGAMSDLMNQIPTIIDSMFAGTPTLGLQKP